VLQPPARRVERAGRFCGPKRCQQGLALVHVNTVYTLNAALTFQSAVEVIIIVRVRHCKDSAGLITPVVYSSCHSTWHSLALLASG